MRIRSVKPEFWTHPVMSRLSDFDRLLALGLLNYADDQGCFLADPSLVRSALRALDESSTNVRRALATLTDRGWIELREHPEMGLLGRVVNFERHQRIDRPGKEKLLKYFNETLDESSTNARRILDEPSLQVLSGNRERGNEGSRERGSEGAGKKDSDDFKIEIAPDAQGQPKLQKQEKPTSRIPTQFAEAQEAICASFAELVGSKYGWQGAKDSEALKRLLAISTLAEVNARWRVALQAPVDEWISARTVANLWTKWNDLADKKPKYVPLEDRPFRRI